MRYTVRKSIVRLVGQIWMPSAVCAQTKVLSSYDVSNIRGQAACRLGVEDNDPSVEITRDNVEQWLCTNSGDFQNVIDFEASIEDGDKTIDIPWSTEEGEFAYSDAMVEGED